MFSQQADNLCNSIGILQQVSQPSPLSGVGNTKAPHNNPGDNTDHTQLFAQMIARTGKDIEVLIDSLPGEESTAELQAAGLRELEQESEMAGEQLRQSVRQGEQLLTSLQVCISLSQG